MLTPWLLSTPWKLIYGEIWRSRGSITVFNSERESQEEEGEGAAKPGGHDKDGDMTLGYLAFSLKLAARIYTTIFISFNLFL